MLGTKGRQLRGSVTVTAEGPLAAYNRLMQEGEIRPDEDQARVVNRLQRLYDELIDYPEIAGHGSGLSIKNWRLAQLFQKSRKTKVPEGVYLVGGVGRGKSMLMDLFYEVAPLKSKKRVHFHEFMLDVHARMKVWRGLSGRERAALGGAPVRITRSRRWRGRLRPRQRFCALTNYR